jgi:hypothetical protein
MLDGRIMPAQPADNLSSDRASAAGLTVPVQAG